jgi:hypothetical protein
VCILVCVELATLDDTAQSVGWCGTGNDSVRSKKLSSFVNFNKYSCVDGAFYFTYTVKPA